MGTDAGKHAGSRTNGNLLVRRPFLLSLLRFLGHCRFLRYGLRLRLIGALSPVGSPFSVSDRPQDDYPFEIPFFGYQYRGNLAVMIDWLVFFFGCYERHILCCLADSAALAARRPPGRDAAGGDTENKTPGIVFLDIGANIGHHSLFMAAHAGRILAFEPYPPVRAELEAKLINNNLSHIEVCPVGLGAKTQHLTFHPPTDANTGTGSFSAPEPNPAMAPAALTLEVVRGDEYLQACTLERLDLIKIDVERHELEVLQGLAETLERFRPVILMESEAGVRACLGDEAGLAALLPPDYHIRALTGPRPRWLLFSEPDSRYHLEPLRFTDPTQEQLLLIPGEALALYAAHIKGP